MIEKLIKRNYEIEKELKDAPLRGFGERLVNEYIVNNNKITELLLDRIKDLERGRIK